MTEDLDVLRQILLEFCDAERVEFDLASIEEHPSARPPFKARWNDDEIVAIEIAEVGPGGGLPPVYNEYMELPCSETPVDLLLHCESYPQPEPEPGAIDSLRQLEVDLLLRGGSPRQPFRRLWLYERSTKRVLGCYY